MTNYQKITLICIFKTGFDFKYENKRYQENGFSNVENVKIPKLHGLLHGRLRNCYCYG